MWSCSKLSFRRFCGHRRRGGRRLHRKDAVLPAPHLTESGPSRRPAPAANPSRGPGLPRLTDIRDQGSWVSGRMSTAMEGVAKKHPRPRRAFTPAGNVRRTRTPIVRRRRSPSNLQRTQNASVRPHRRRQRTQSGGRPRQPGNVRRTRTPIVRRRRHPGNLQRTQNASVRPHRRRQPPPAHTNHPSVLPCRYSTPDQIHDLRYADKGIAAHSCPAVPHPCCPAVPHRCQNAAETAVQHSRKDSAVAPRCLNGAGTAMPRSQRRSAARNAPTGTNRNISITFIRFAPPRRSML
jgi:hypothetical protein